MDEEIIVKADQIPSQAHRLYVQLYCERKGEKNIKTEQEARKSWASLSLSKKKLFYKTTAKRNSLCYAHGLSKTKIYLKEKGPKIRNRHVCKPQYTNEEHKSQLEQPETSIDESHITENRSQREDNEFSCNQTENVTKFEDANETTLNIGSDDIQASFERPPSPFSTSNFGNNTKLEDADELREANTGSPLYERSSPSQVDETEDALETQSNTSSIQRGVIPLAEPTPPIVKLGKDLYNAIKGPGAPEWRDLIKRERNHYNSAVCIIKRDYIKSYILYLESLSKQQLFDHYIKVLH